MGLLSCCGSHGHSSPPELQFDQFASSRHRRFSVPQRGVDASFSVLLASSPSKDANSHARRATAPLDDCARPSCGTAAEAPK